MDIPKITDGEYNIMNALWDTGPLPATDIVRLMNRDIGWNRNTTYTFINRLVGKQVIRREEPGFICTPLFTREEIGKSETRSLLNKMFGGSLKSMVASFIDADASEKEINEVKQMLADMAKEERKNG